MVEELFPSVHRRGHLENGTVKAGKRDTDSRQLTANH